MGLSPGTPTSHKKCWLESQLLHFWPSSLLMVMGSIRWWLKYLSSCCSCGRLRWSSWFLNWGGVFLIIVERLESESGDRKISNSAHPSSVSLSFKSKQAYGGVFCAPMYITAEFTMAEIGNQLRCPSTDYWRKRDVVCIWYTATKKNEISPFATKCIQLETIKLNEIIQFPEDNYNTLSLICDN